MKTAIIIGASTGIGRATALALSGKYNSISITSFKHKEELLSLRDELMAKGCICYCETGDAGDMEFMEKFIQNTIDHLGSDIDLLINNAGISYVGLINDMTAQDLTEP